MRSFLSFTSLSVALVFMAQHAFTLVSDETMPPCALQCMTDFFGCNDATANSSCLCAAGNNLTVETCIITNCTVDDQNASGDIFQLDCGIDVGDIVSNLPENITDTNATSSTSGQSTATAASNGNAPTSSKTKASTAERPAIGVALALGVSTVVSLFALGL